VVKAIAIVVTVFVLGALSGGAVMYALRPEPAAGAPPAGVLTAEERADRLTHRLGLSPAQRESVVGVLRGHHARMQEHRARLNREVREILDDSQRERFNQFARP
jgi:uncharacterized membrane protein